MRPRSSVASCLGFTSLLANGITAVPSSEANDEDSVSPPFIRHIHPPAKLKRRKHCYFPLLCLIHFKWLILPGRVTFSGDGPSIMPWTFHPVPCSFHLCKETFVHSPVYHSQGSLNLCTSITHSMLRYAKKEHQLSTSRIKYTWSSRKFIYHHLPIIVLGNENYLLSIETLLYL